ncbi:MAG: GWxTD domain-containing protein, partial [bacterium]|nr:GWxTD domain-containing protein [bacterium]
THILKNNRILTSDTLNVEDRIDSLEQITAGQKFAELSAFGLPEGSYVVKSELIDLSSKQSITLIDSIKIRTFSFDTLTLSSITLASSICPQQVRETKFDKNGLRVIPNAERIYGKESPNLYFYAEAYNFAWDDNGRSSPYQVTYKVKDMNGINVLNFEGLKKNKPGPTSVVYGSIDVAKLTTGSYILELEVKDHYDMRQTRSTKQFFIYNKSDLLKKTEINKQIVHANIEKYNQMDEDELDHYFNQLKYITDKQEKAIFRELGLEGKRNFFISFWSQRDPNPDTPLNEYEMRYNYLIKIANENFTTIFKEGWESDRGRVLLLYGLPDSKDIVPTSMDTKAHEIWQYYKLESGAKFVFVDKNLNGDYVLVHSTKRGEIQDPDWWLHHARL